MRFIAGIMLTSMACASSAQTPAAPPALTADGAYTNSFLAPVIATRCSEVFPKFKDYFEPAFETWKDQNSALIEAGREAQEAKLKPGETLAASESRLSRWVGLGASTMQGEQLKNRCAYLLQELAGPESK